MREADLRDQTRRLLTRLDRAGGELEALRRRDEELTLAVGLAKGRMDRKDAVADYLDRLQSAAHERNVGSYERLLTGLVSDIIETESKVGLELSTERGLPSLEIFMKPAEDLREDIMDGNGGALTNVICLGLRAIATAKAHKRMFMALDEPDCWVERGRIERFYSVIKQLASSIGLQCLFIAHHDISAFTDGIAVSRLSAASDGALVLEKDPRAAKWASDDQPGIRFIRLVNFMSHVDTMLTLSPGVNALLGSVNLGKSVFMRALRAAAYGESADSDIRHGEKRLEAHFGLEYGRTLIFSREKKRSPVNLWTVIDAQGQVVEENGTRYETGGRNVPDWVERVLQMPMMDGLDIHVSHQKKPVFLLGDNASKRASVLSVGQESSHIQAMIARHKEWCTADNATVRNGEKELGSIRARIAAIEPLEELRPALAAVGEGLTSLAAEQNKVAQMTAASGRIVERASGLQDVRAQLAALDGLPDEAPIITDTASLLAIGRRLRARTLAIDTCAGSLVALEALPDTSPSVTEVEPIHAAGRKIADASQRAQTATRLLTALSAIPDAAPALSDGAAMRTVQSRLDTLTATIEDKQRELVAVDDEISVCRAEAGKTLELTGGRCPTCNGGIDDIDHLLHAAD